MSASLFTDPALCIIFAYAPAGLGHLRVTDALRHGLPSGASVVLLPQSSESIRWIHRLTSKNPLGKKLMEWGQYGWAEEWITRAYRSLLRHDASSLEVEILKVLKQRATLPKHALIVASHFGLAHQLSIVKKNIEQKAQVQLRIAMQVTDDSPQKIWYVPTIDLITVPSELTRRALLRYGAMEHLGSTRIAVLPYPLSPHLGEKLLPAALMHRWKQVQPRERTPINISIPISGAGVGLTFIQRLMKELHRKSERYAFHIIVKQAYFTELFLHTLKRTNYISVESSHSDREIVELYEQLFDRVVVSLEVTKPSEQAFKALFTPSQSGGVILLFTQPVGRQEYDNLDFLTRHGLIPNSKDQEILFDMAAKNTTPIAAQKQWLLTESIHWRGMRLPADATQAALYIQWCQKTMVFAQMHRYALSHQDKSLELGGNGVTMFWNQIEKNVLKWPQSS